MFIIIRIVSLFFLITQCKNSDNHSNENPIAQQGTVISNKNTVQAQEKLLSVTYHAESRGAFYEVEVNEQEVATSNVRSGEDKKSKLCTKKEWSIIQSELKNIDLQKLKELKAPSDNKNVDRSLHAKLTIAFPTQSYTSVSFDHGNPPVQIAPLVNTILSLAESIE